MGSSSPGEHFQERLVSLSRLKLILGVLGMTGMGFSPPQILPRTSLVDTARPQIPLVTSTTHFPEGDRTVYLLSEPPGRDVGTRERATHSRREVEFGQVLDLWGWSWGEW